MTNEIFSKLESFIDDLIEFKLDTLQFDIFEENKKNRRWFYTFSVDTQFQVNFISNTPPLIIESLYFSTSPQTGLILLTKNNQEDFRVFNVDMATKLSKKIEDANNKKLLKTLDKIIESTFSELKIAREQNIKKLIG